jgi:hypothetical protein
MAKMEGTVNERMVMKFKGQLSERRPEDTTMSTGPQASSTNEDKEAKRILKSMGLTVKK